MAGGVGWGQLGETIAFTLIRLVDGGGLRLEITEITEGGGNDRRGEMRRGTGAEVENHSDQCHYCSQYQILWSACVFPSGPSVLRQTHLG